MRALTFQGLREVSCETVPDPEILQPGDAIVKVELAGICGSDLHVYHGRERGIDAGTVMGHEFVGEIVDTGRHVQTFRRGQKVMSPFTSSCGACYYCRTGLTSRCDQGELFGWVENGQGLHGAQAEYVRVPLASSTLMAIPDGMPPEAALLLGDVFATGYFCAHQAEIHGGGTYAVIGCGPVGLMAVLSARLQGAERLFAIDLISSRLKLAAEFGATPIDPSEADCEEVIADATGGRGVDAVMEAVGQPSAQELAFSLVRPGGIISVVGVHTRAEFAFSPADAYDKNLTYKAGRCPARRYMEEIIPAVDRVESKLRQIISHRLPLIEGTRGYEMFDQKLDECTKVVLEVE